MSHEATIRFVALKNGYMVKKELTVKYKKFLFSINILVKINKDKLRCLLLVFYVFKVVTHRCKCNFKD